MAETTEETIITTETQPTEKPSRAGERIEELSEKVKTTSKERDDALAKVAAADRRTAFAEGYADIVATNPAAKEYKSDIEAKVNAGLTVEDATYAVLGKAGKLGQVAQVERIHVAGGSADTSPQSGQKEIKDMSQAERRAQLEKDLIWQ